MKSITPAHIVKYMMRFSAALIVSLLAVTHANAAEPSPENSIQSIDHSVLSGGAVVIKIGLKQGIQSAPAGFAVNNPPRIALDFPNTANALGKNTISVDAGVLRNMNVVQSGNRTRLVLNLSKPASYETRIEEGKLLVTLQASEIATATSNVTTQFAEDKRGTQKHSIRDIDFRRGKNGEGRIIVDLSDTNTGIDIRKQGKALIVDFVGTAIPNNLERRLDVLDFGTPVQTVDTYRQGDNIRMVIEPKGLWEHAAYQTDRQFIVEVKPVIEDQNKLAQGSKPKYSGEKLSLNFQNVEIRSVLQVIADFTGLNIITSDTVSGNLTLRLKDVPWDQALDIILQSKGLAMRKNGSVILIAPSDELATKEKLELESKQAISELEPVQTESFQLKYQKAEAFKKILSDDKQKILSKRGSAVIDERTNTLFIQDTPSKLEELRRIINQVDVPVKQVMIEARIVEASDSFAKNLGARLGHVSTNLDAGGVRLSTTGKAEDFANLFPKTPPSFTEIPTNQAVRLAAPSIDGNLAGSFAMLISSKFAGSLYLELSALQADGRGKIISNPRVVTADQVEATIEQGTEIPYQQSTSSGATSISFKKASLSLKVKPQITPDDRIIMDLQVNKDSRGTDTPSGPAIDTKQIATQVLVDNGDTIVVGGIYSQEQKEQVYKVPLFGDIPVLGNLFKQTDKLNNKNELLIFVTPKILKESVNIR